MTSPIGIRLQNVFGSAFSDMRFPMSAHEGLDGVLVQRSDVDSNNQHGMFWRLRADIETFEKSWNRRLERTELRFLAISDDGRSMMFYVPGGFVSAWPYHRLFPQGLKGNVHRRARLQAEDRTRELFENTHGRLAPFGFADRFEDQRDRLMFIAAFA